jgi:predicted transcriptional regulator
MPIISDKIPSPCAKLVSGDIMQPNPINFLSVESMKNVQRALLNCDHRGFPIVNQENYLIGFIPRNFIIVLIENRAFYNMQVDEASMSSAMAIR